MVLNLFYVYYRNVYGNGSSFALIVILLILLNIFVSSFMNREY
ncbi:YjcZ family sporulation protein [Lysinibacillus sp. Ag94]|nr:YjcZ family sporulation protein [Lysinibacillus sp. Ag94]